MTRPASNYLAIDPGETSGWALLSYTGGFHSGQMPFAPMIDSIRDTVREITDQKLPIQLFSERAYASPKDMTHHAIASLEWELETIGCMKWIARSFGIRPVVVISQSESKQFGTTELLRKLDWWFVGLEHANDAARVLARAVSQRDHGYWKPLVREAGVLDGHG